MGGVEQASSFLAPTSAAILVSALFAAGFAVPLMAQAPANATVALPSPKVTGEKLEFDVASVKQNKTGNQPDSNVPLGIGDIYSPTGGYFSAKGFSLLTYIVFAYKIANSQAQYLPPQLPGWATSDRFDIQARVEGNPTKDQMRAMMQSLLEDRFKLAIHHQTRELPVYALLLTKSGSFGPQLQRHPDSSSCGSEPAPPSPSGSTSAPTTVAGGFPVLCGGISGLPPSEPGRVRVGARKLTMGFISGSNVLMGNLDRPVLDRTGLSGSYDFILEWTPERRGPPQGASSESDDSGPTFQQALKEQLGLKLESQKARSTSW
jgi:uncharacterized protein (TIGR03435 family)